MLNQAAYDIYRTAAEATDELPMEPVFTTSQILGEALKNAQYHRSYQRWEQFDIWIKAVEDLTKISRAERGAL